MYKVGRGAPRALEATMDGREVAKVRRPASEMWAKRLAEASGLIAGAIEDIQSVQQSFDDGRVLYRWSGS